MTTYTVVFAPEAEEQLAALYRYIADHASPDVALHYTNAIVAHCEGLNHVPLRGRRREDIRAGLRITHYKGRAIIAFAVDAAQVSILGVFYGGQDYETFLQSDPGA
ncbi:MAG: type II toxin-antitoxin system RelE/ParE family toxin [Pseudomonadota bacterium]